MFFLKYLNAQRPNLGHLQKNRFSDVMLFTSFRIFNLGTLQTPEWGWITNPDQVLSEVWRSNFVILIVIPQPIKPNPQINPNHKNRLS